jgi:hypothetical protein
MEEHENVDPRDAIPEDERITLPDLSKVFEDEDGVDPFDPDIIPSDDDLPPPYDPQGEA